MEHNQPINPTAFLQLPANLRLVNRQAGSAFLKFLGWFLRFKFVVQRSLLIQPVTRTVG
jgi:hypothetical protein